MNCHVLFETVSLLVCWVMGNLHNSSITDKPDISLFKIVII